MQGAVIEQGTTNFGISNCQFSMHAAIHAARPDLRCIIGVLHSAVVAISSFKHGLLPLTKDSAVLGEIARHNVSGGKLFFYLTFANNNNLIGTIYLI